MTLRRPSILATAGWLLVLACARADDSSKGVPLAGLRSTPAGAVSVRSAAVELRTSGTVAVTLKLVAPRRGVRTPLKISMSRFGWLGEAEPYPDRQFPELKISLGEGSAVEVESSFSAYVGSTEVTAAIRDAGLDPYLIADSPPLIRFAAEDQSKVGRLEELGVIHRQEGEFLANWTVERRVKFRPGEGESEIKLEYKSRPAFELTSFSRLAANSGTLAKYCLTAAGLTSLLGAPLAERMLVVSQYEIPASVDAKPVKGVSISIDLTGTQGRPRPTVAFCGANGRALAGASPIRAQGRADSSGTVHLLSITVPGN